MMNKFIPFLAFKYLYSSGYERSISVVTVICFISIAIGSGSLLLVNAIMQGFQTAVHTKLKGIHADAHIQSSGSPLDHEALTAFIENHIPEIQATSPTSTGYALIHSEHLNQPTLAMLAGIDPDREQAVTTLASMLTSGASLSNAVRGTAVAIGSTLAQEHNLQIGSPLTLYYFDDLEPKKKFSARKQETTVGGIFSTGIDEYDASSVLISFDLFNTMFPDQGVDTIKVAFHPDAPIESVLQKIKTHTLLNAYSWQELYPSLVSALALERYAMFFILLLITIVASMNIIALLSMLIQAKRSDIAMLYAMGASIRDIKLLFMMVAVLLTMCAAGTGIALAVALCFALKTYPLITLPDAYYVTQLPVHLTWHMVLLVWGTVVAIAIIATLIPLARIKTNAIAHMLRYEG